MIEAMETNEDYVRNIKAVRLADYNGNLGFYGSAYVSLVGPSGLDNDMGFSYLVKGSNYDSGFDDVLAVFGSPEKAWAFYLDFMQKLEASKWRRDYLHGCILDPEGIPFALSGEAIV